MAPLKCQRINLTFSLSGSSCCKYGNTQIVLTQRMERDCCFNHFVISGVDSSYLYANPSVDVSPDATEARCCTRSALLQECRQAEWKFTGCPQEDSGAKRIHCWIEYT